MQVFIACGLSKSGKAETESKEDDPFRKPKPGMWQLMEQHFNSGIAIDMDQLFFLTFNCSIDAYLFHLSYLNFV